MSGAPLIVNGWEIYAHPLFLDQIEAMIGAVEAARARDPSGYSRSRAAKLLAATLKVAFEAIPGDPTREDYRQGATLGADNKHWFRAKYLQQYRLFFRYRQSEDSKVIVLAWVNDEKSLRAYGSKKDAYVTFAKMLKNGDPPGDWETLFAASSGVAATSRLKRARP